MNKQEMIDVLAQQLDSSKAYASEVVDLIFAPEGIIASELRKGNRVQISGFGNFETRTRGPRQGRNPQTGETISIEGAVVPAFRPGKTLKELVNRKR